MSLVKLTQHRADGICWQCPSNKGQKVGIRKGSYFENSNLKLDVLLSMAYLWSWKIPVTTVAALVGVHKDTAVQWYQYFCDVCANRLVNHPIHLGGPGHIVQINESVMSKWKYGWGRQVAKHWVFGMYDCVQKMGILQFVDNRSAATLLPIIQEHSLPGSKIHSDCWAAYNGIDRQANKIMNGTTEAHLESHLDEFMWCQMHSKKASQCLII